MKKLFARATRCEKQKDFYYLCTLNSCVIVLRFIFQGETFYIVDKGEFKCYINVGGSGDTKNSEKKLIHEYKAAKTGIGNPSFGELALMYSKPRAATVIAKTAGSLWTLDRRAFRKVLMKGTTKELVRNLRSVDVLGSLSKSNLQRLADMLTEVQFKDKEMIITQGDIGSTFYILRKGAARVTILSEDELKAKKDPRQGNCVMELQENQYFGERALLHEEPRAATVTASGDVTCLYIGRKAFEEVLGPLADLINDDRGKREAQAMSKAAINETQKAEGLVGVQLSDLEERCTTSKWGSGAFSLVKCKINNKIYTVKRVDKKMADELDEVDMVWRDRDALLNFPAEHPIRSFVPNVAATFQTSGSLHMLLKTEIIGDIYSMISSEIPFDHVSAQYVTASLVLTLSFLHKSQILFRGISTQTVVVDHNGYVQCPDMRFCKRDHSKKLSNSDRTYVS